VHILKDDNATRQCIVYDAIINVKTYTQKVQFQCIDVMQPWLMNLLLYDLVEDKTDVGAVFWLQIWSNKKEFPAWELVHCRMLGEQEGTVNIQA